MKKNLISAVAIMLCTAMLLSLAGCFTVTVQFPSAENTENGDGDGAGDFIQTPDGVETHPADTPSEAAAETQAQTTVQPTSQTSGQTEPPTAAPVQPAAETTDAPAENKTPDKLSGQALLTYFNDAINTVKTQKAGFRKSKLTTIKDLKLSNSMANTLVGFVKGALLSETEDITDVKKGQSSDSVLSPSGKSYASALTMNDIKNISAVKSGSGYVITVNLKDEQNPASDGTFSRCMDYMTVDDVEKIYAPKVGAAVTRSNITVKLSNSSAKLTVDANGKVTGYETLVNGLLTMKDASIKKVVTINTDLDILLSSTTKYTNFEF